MTLTGILDVLIAERTGDPALRGALEAARAGGRRAARPHRTARRPAVRAGRPRRPRRSSGARRHRDRARGRGPRDRAARPAAARLGRRVPVLGDAAARAAQPAQRHRRPPPRRCCAAWPTRTPTTPGTARSRSSSRRCGPLLQPMVAGLGDLEPVELRAGDEVDLDDVAARLAAAAYARVDLVEKRGEFAVRGGILDVFPPTEEHPLRVEFWGDTVEEVRWFKVADQRSLEVADATGLWAPPCRELLLTDEVRERAGRSGRSSTPAWPTCSTSSPRASRSRAWSRSPRCSSTTWCCCSTRCPPGTHVVLRDPERVRTRAHDLFATSQEFLEASWATAAAGGADAGRPRRGGVPQPRRGPRAGARPRLAVVVVQPVRRRRGAPTTPRRRSSRPAPSTATAATPSARSPTSRAGSATAGGSCWSPRATARPSGWSRCSAARTSPARLDEDLDARARAVGRARHLRRPARTASSATSCASRSLTETDLTGQAGPSTKDMRRMPSRRRNAVDPLQLQGRRPRRARAARRRPVRRDGAAHRGDGHPRVPRHRVRAVQARPAGRPALRPDRPARPGHPVRRRRGAEPAPARRRRLAEGQGPRPQGRQADRGRADPALRRAHGRAGLRLRRRTPRGSASSRTPSRTSRRPTSSRPSTRSRPTWRRRSRWTG